MLAIRLPEDVEKRLDELARRTGRTKTFYAREAILEHLNDLEGLHFSGKTPNRFREGLASSPVGPSFVRPLARAVTGPAARSDERYLSLAKKYL